MEEFDHIIQREQQKTYDMRNEAFFAFYLQARINAQQARVRFWRWFTVISAALLLPLLYLLINVNTVVDLYLGAAIRATVPMLYNGTLLFVGLALTVACLGHLVSRR
jgi:hypothetical protein